MTRSIDTRVGYAAVSALAGILEDELECLQDREKDLFAPEAFSLLVRWNEARLYLMGIKMSPGSRLVLSQDYEEHDAYKHK